jgi:hypothetical protein
MSRSTILIDLPGSPRAWLTIHADGRIVEHVDRDQAGVAAQDTTLAKLRQQHKRRPDLLAKIEAAAREMTE